MKKLWKKIWPPLKSILWILGSVLAGYIVYHQNIFSHVAAVAGILVGGSAAMGLHSVAKSLGGMYCVDCGTCMVRANGPDSDRISPPN